MKERVLSRHDRIRLLLETCLDYLPPLPIARYGQQAPLLSDPMIHEAVALRNDDQGEGDAYRANQRELDRLEREMGLRQERATKTRRERHYASGSYANLDAAMDLLRDVDPFSHRVLHRTYLDHLVVASPDIVSGCIEALAYWMPAEIRLPDYVADRAGETLNVRIRLLHAEHPSKSQAWLAKRLNTSQATVSRALSVGKRTAA